MVINFWVGQLLLADIEIQFHDKHQATCNTHSMAWAARKNNSGNHMGYIFLLLITTLSVNKKNLGYQQKAQANMRSQ